MYCDRDPEFKFPAAHPRDHLINIKAGGAGGMYSKWPPTLDAKFFPSTVVMNTCLPFQGWGGRGREEDDEEKREDGEEGEEGGGEGGRGQGG